MPNYERLEQSRESNSADNPIDIFVNDLRGGCRAYREQRRSLTSRFFNLIGMSAASEIIRGVDAWVERGDDDVYSLLTRAEHVARGVAGLKSIVDEAKARLFSTSLTHNNADYQTYKAINVEPLIRQRLAEVGFDS